MSVDMPLWERLDQDYRAALKAHEDLTVSTIRLVKAAAQNARVAKGAPLDEPEMVGVIVRQAKQRREAIIEFRRAGRTDLATKEEVELHILERYLPQQLPDDEIRTLVDSALSELDTAGPTANPNAIVGQVMRLVMPQIKGRADGARVNEIVRAALTTR